MSVIPENFIKSLNWDKKTNLRITVKGEEVVLLPTTLVCHKYEIPLGTVYSNKKSLELSLERGKCIFYTRSREGIWIKSPSGVNAPKLLEIRQNCNQDSLIFIVEDRGHFCHRNGCSSCFENVPFVSFASPPIKIGYCLGRQEPKAMELFRDVGIHVYKELKSRNDTLLVKTHLHPNVQLFAFKPKDIGKMYSSGVIDVAVCYEDNIFGISDHNQRKFMRTGNKKGKTLIKYVAIRKKGSVLPKNPKIFSECNDLITVKWIENTALFEKKEKKSIIDTTVYVNGHTEHLISKGVADIGVVICESGETIESNGTEIIETVCTSDLVVLSNIDMYHAYPRFFRNLSNGLASDTIYFYSVDEPEGFMSNLYPCKFVDTNGVQWNSTEHYYQAYKFIEHKKVFEEIRLQPTAKLAYKRAYLDYSTKNIFMNVTTGQMWHTWLERRDQVMFYALLYKFDQNMDLRTKLLATGEKKLVEHALKDRHFGCGDDGNGENILGHMLMFLRHCYKHVGDADLCKSFSSNGLYLEWRNQMGMPDKFYSKL